jgi:FkbM family methyltransferase
MSPAAGREFAIFFLVMIHRKVFDKIGLLNTDYGVGGCEDIEFCIEAENVGFEVCLACDLVWNEKNQIYTSVFPVHHKGEGTVHDPLLVPEWASIFKENSLKLAKKYNIDWYNKNITATIDYKDKLRFMEAQHPEIYKEIIVDNVYNLTTEQVKNKFVIDIGANIGTYSLLAAELGAKQVYSVEPVSATFDQLYKNINIGKYKNIIPLKYAVSDVSNEFVNIAIMSDNGHNTIYKSENSKQEKVSTITLTELLDKCNDSVVLKIDCEGAEYDIIMNSTAEIMSKVDRIMLEVHGDMHPTYKGHQVLNDKLKSFGFILENFKQMYFWQYNDKGEQIDCKEPPCRIEMWKR